MDVGPGQGDHVEPLQLAGATRKGQDMQEHGIRRLAGWIAAGSLVGAMAATATTARAQLVIYPAKGQNEQQQQKDHGECHIWAKNQTGVDPVAIASQAAPAPSGPQGERLKGAAKGAAVGAVGGAIAGDAGTGAAAGAAVGTMAGGARQRQKAKEEAKQAQQVDQQKQAQITQFNKAYAACLEGRGYSVK
jgi:YMGG-like Gly-zipper